MEVTATAGPSSEVSPPATYDDDSRHIHFASNVHLSPSQAIKPTASMPLLVTTPSQSPEMNAKDLKSMGTRFHEDCHEVDTPTLRVRPSRLFKEKEPAAVEPEIKKPLCLLDLPVDILKDIVKEVTHTNDLTALALCHSALHRLTIPHIYSRFDIVWPDNTAHAEPRSGVDALTYGLATLVMAEEIFGEAPNQRRNQTNRFSVTGRGRATETAIRRRRGNHYAQFTKKFSLGNGPKDWVQEYLISKEGGKMLGTLVALALARMRSLETFIWDMPTGILRDVWLALSSLGDHDEDQNCRLEKVWVRWHDNSAADITHPIPPPPAPVNIPTGGPPLLQSSVLNTPIFHVHPAVLDRVEHPSFSVLPALKSLSVLDIDELGYLDEMAVLIGRSINRLKELRVGIARHALTKDWVTVWEGDSLQQVDPEYPTAGTVTIGEKRLGGVLGILSGFVCDMRQPRAPIPDLARLRRTSSRAIAINQDGAAAVQDLPVDSDAAHAAFVPSEALPELPEDDAESSFVYMPSSPIPTEAVEHYHDAAATTDLPLSTEQEAAPQELVQPLEYSDGQTSPTNDFLQLEILELERVPISVPVLQKAIDWTRITSLTFLHCANHEQLWKTLRRTFAPTPKLSVYPNSRRPSSLKKSNKGFADADLDYKLNIKKIHTNTVSSALISFMKETLAPNSLEVLFFQEARSYSSSVNVDAIYRGPLRRHRGSLKKVLIDSSEKSPDGLHANSSRWRRWMLNRDILSFICSGKMPALRELGMSLDYRDWHFFLQHLPLIPQLRSLYIPFLADHVHGAALDPRELALQIVDIVALRPEVELCYMGIANKCFEILENSREADGRPESQLGLLPGGHVDPEAAAEDDDEDEDDEDADDDEEEDEDDEDTESDDEDEADDDTDSEADGPVYDGNRNAAKLRLREILFYDDKVAVFKARHGRL